MKEQQENTLQLRSHKRKFWTQGTCGAQCTKMLVISTDDVMCVNALEGWLNKVWLS
jgi:hypothetical protein